ncbi:MAG: elongation factor Ts [Bacteroidales bacterium]|nr:elongation factor Ts [Bacteroidales bacterium]MBQ5959021.1 elongation factor Ts [Bacteroidales bacterium]
MNITASQVNELRQMTGAGMMDCKKALVETDGDIQAAIDILRKKGMAKAAKRADRNASEGCVLSKSTDDHKYAAIVMVNCETDFVANNADFVKFTKDVLDKAVANRVKNIDELKAMDLNGQTVEALVANQSAVTGEKTELGAFKVLEGAYVTNYNHPGNRLATIVEMNKSFDGIEEVSHEVAMHVAAMNPMAVSEAAISQEVKDRELAVAVDKTKEELIGKEVEKALRKVGINPNHVDSDDHIDSNITKGYITAEQGAQAREIKATVPGTVNLNEGMVQNIAKGRLGKFFKENCLLNQVSLVADPKTVGQYIQDADKEATVNAFFRVKLGE